MASHERIASPQPLRDEIYLVWVIKPNRPEKQIVVTYCIILSSAKVLSSFAADAAWTVRD
jgi:hypothetical protein